MKPIQKFFYFLIGFILPFFLHTTSYSYTCSSDSIPEACKQLYVGGDFAGLTNYVGTYSTEAEAIAARDAASVGYDIVYPYAQTTTCEGVVAVMKYAKAWNSSWQPQSFPLAWWKNGCQQYVPDDDGDGILNQFDLNPNSSASYSAAIVSVCYDSNNKIVAGVIQDSNGNQYMFGTMPTNMEGYTIESVSGNQIQYQTGESLADALSKLDISDLNLHKLDSKVDVQDDGTYIPGSSGPLDDWNNKEEDQTKAPTPDVTDAPSNLPGIDDTDSKHLENLVKNTDATNTNLKNLAKYLGISNDLLAKINDKTGSTSVTSGDTNVEFETPSADEIGQSIKDKLIDPSQTIGNQPNGTETVPDKTDDLNNTKTEFSDRFSEFTDVLRNSDLFSLPFSIFEGPTSSGSSVQSVNIGKWGSSSDQTATIDFSDYDAAWETLRSVLMLLTSFGCFKILVLKKA